MEKLTIASAYLWHMLSQQIVSIKVFFMWQSVHAHSLWISCKVGRPLCIQTAIWAMFFFFHFFSMKLVDFQGFPVLGLLQFPISWVESPVIVNQAFSGLHPILGPKEMSSIPITSTWEANKKMFIFKYLKTSPLIYQQFLCFLFIIYHHIGSPGFSFTRLLTWLAMLLDHPAQAL